MFPATLVSKTMNAMKLNTAAQTHRRARREHARRHDRGDRVRGVVEPVDEVEGKRQGDHGDQRERHQEYSSTTPSRMFATSSQRSVAASRLS